MNEITTKCPDRSPLCIAEALEEIIKGKTVCDIGCREGDIMIAFSKYAKEVIGIDWDSNNVKKARDKGLMVTLQSYRDMTLPLPKADVYYIWIGKNVNLEILNRIGGSIAVIGGDPSVNEIYNLPGSKVLKVPYNEGEGHRENGIFELTIIDRRDKNSEQGEVNNDKVELRSNFKKPDAVDSRVPDKPVKPVSKGNRSRSGK